MAAWYPTWTMFWYIIVSIKTDIYKKHTYFSPLNDWLGVNPIQEFPDLKDIKIISYKECRSLCCNLNERYQRLNQYRYKERSKCQSSIFLDVQLGNIRIQQAPVLFKLAQLD
jgi:hypothetical protein